MLTQTPADYAFPVQLQDIQTLSGQIIPRHKAVVRTDTNKALSVVSDRYALFRHDDVMTRIEPFVEALGKPVSRFFLERDGARLVAEHTFKEHRAQLPAHGTKDRAVGDTVGLRLLVINSYNSSTSLEMRLGAIVLRCLNGMTIPSDDFSVKFRHMGNENWRDQFPKPESVVAAFETANTTWKQWADTPLTLEKKGEIIEEAKRLQVVSRSALQANTTRFYDSETAWDLYNAFTYVTTHTMTRVQASGKIQRVDRLNGIFAAAIQ